MMTSFGLVQKVGCKIKPEHRRLKMGSMKEIILHLDGGSLSSTVNGVQEKVCSVSFLSNSISPVTSCRRLVSKAKQKCVVRWYHRRGFCLVSQKRSCWVTSCFPRLRAWRGLKHLCEDLWLREGVYVSRGSSEANFWCFCWFLLSVEVLLPWINHCQLIIHRLSITLTFLKRLGCQLTFAHGFTRRSEWTINISLGGFRSV